MSDNKNVLEGEAPWYFWVLLFVTIALCAGTPDLLDAIVEVVQSRAVCP